VVSVYYSDERVTIYHGDFLDVVDQLGPVDAVVTSPPYNVGIDYGPTWDDQQPPTAYVALVERWCKAIATVLDGQGRAFVNVAPVVSLQTSGVSPGPAPDGEGGWWAEGTTEAQGGFRSADQAIGWLAGDRGGW
jgi:DNA modification methylase